MKIGILTFHSQQNYGGVLQCWALKKTLESLGHEVVVIDRWLDSRRSLLRPLRTIRGLIRFVCRLMYRCTDLGPILRQIRTERFVKALSLTPYHFVNWKDAPEDLGVDVVIVGSDQVWHCGNWGDPGAYLLEGFSGKLPRVISYAASFGMRSLPDNSRELFQRGLSRFSAISCREVEGVDICRELGFSATHVVDPTLLVDSSCWDQLFKKSSCRSPLTTHTSAPCASSRTLVCYFISVKLYEVLPQLEAFAARNDCMVEIILNDALIRSPSHTIRELVDRYFVKISPASSRIRICTSDGPSEFVERFTTATWILSDSFHAMMFSSIFDKNFRFIKPSTPGRKGMFARIEEFVSRNATGPLLSDSVVSALDSFSGGETVSYNRAELAETRAASLDWLKKAVG